MIKPNWDLFRSKFSENPQENFEWFCYMLFCRRYGIDYIHRYKNQAGIETDPIEVDGIKIAWQSKFYEDTLTNHISDIEDMINKISKYYPEVRKVLFYTNSEWGQNSGTEPKGKKRVQDFACKKNIEIEWLVKSFFESETVAIDNEDISKYFFQHENSIIDIVQRLKDHTENVLSKIDNVIFYNGKVISISRACEIQELSTNEGLVFITGNGGVGKTAIIKEYYNNINEINGALYLIKSNELIRTPEWMSNTDLVNEFIEFHNMIDEKLFVIDSAEKLSDFIEDIHLFYFINRLIKTDWKVLFTLRNSYNEALTYKLNDIINLMPKKIEITPIKLEVLNNVALENKFTLPSSKRLQLLLTTPFYLNEYLKVFSDEKKLDYVSFKNSLWENVIQKGNPRRDKFFIDFAVAKTNKLAFYYETDDEIALEFHNEGLLGYETYGYFITHDIYEEWALERYVEKSFQSSDSILIFFEILGTNLPIRRAFRSWISDLIFDRNNAIYDFIDSIFKVNIIPGHWIDEVLIAIMYSEYSEMFFDEAKDRILENIEFFIKKISALLVTACKTVDYELSKEISTLDNGHPVTITSPIGDGWNAFISFIFDNKSDVKIEKIGSLIKVFYEWTSKYKHGLTTRYAGLLALEYYRWHEVNFGFISSKFFKGKLYKVIVMSAYEIKDELSNIVSDITENKWNKHRDPYKDLFEYIIDELNGAIIVEVIPDRFIELLKLFWIIDDESNNRRFHQRNDIEQYFGLNNMSHNYYPASAYKTPLLKLLKVDFKMSLDFIILIVDYVTECYVNSTLSENEIIMTDFIHDNGEKIEIALSNRLWCTYRGTQTSSHVIESVLMALENYLIGRGKNTSSKILTKWMLYILENTKSAMLIGLVTSIICAFPDKLFDVAITLFSNEYFLMLDQRRKHLEHASLFGAMNRSSLFRNERQTSNKLNHRSVDLEDLFAQYAIFYSRQSDEEGKLRYQQLNMILENFYSSLNEEPTPDELTWRMSLARMDVRKMDIEETTIDGKKYTVYDPHVDDEVEIERKKLLAENNDRQTYLALKLWANYRIEGNIKYKDYPKYEENIESVVIEFYELIFDIEKKNANKLILVGEGLKYLIAAVLYKDFYDTINSKEKILCEKLIVEGLKKPYTTNYNYNSLDGVDCIFKIIPEIMLSNRELLEDNILYIIFGLTDDNPINSSETFSKYLVDALSRISKEGNYDFVLTILNKFLLISQIYEKLSNNRQAISVFNIMQEKHQNEIYHIISASTYHQMKFSEYNPHAVSKYFQVVASTKNECLNELKLVTSQVVLEKLYKYEKTSGNPRFDDNFIREYCRLLLEVDIEKRVQLIYPLLNNAMDSKTTTYIVEELIYQEDAIQQQDSFWWIMNQIKTKLIQECEVQNSQKIYGFRRYYDLMKYLLLGGFRWNPDAKKWHSFTRKNLRYFSDFVNHLYMIKGEIKVLLELLGGIGSEFQEEGVTWISTILEKKYELDDNDRSEQVIVGLEIFIRKFINNHRKDINKNRSLKNKVLIILDYLVSSESIVGYMLRDDIL